MNKHEKFLKFNGKNIFFLNKDGVYWVALKPILDALEVDSDSALKTLKKDSFLGSRRSRETVQVEKNGKKQGRQLTCLPEEFIYGWLLTLRSDSEELKRYKWTCYRLLYNHFHGTITNRKELLVERNAVDTEIHQLKEELKEEAEKFNKMSELQTKRKMLSQQLNTIDKEMIDQPGLFDDPEE